MRFTLLFFTLTLILSACSNSTQTSEQPVPTDPNSPKKYTLTAFEPSAEFPDATIASFGYTKGQFSFDVQNYELGSQTDDAPQKMCANSAKGQHIHLIVDDKPYAAKYTADFAHDVENGSHYILAFLSRSYHESIKTENAHVAVKVSIKDKTIGASFKVDDPMLFYSRPKGTYTGKDTEKVMLDFFLVNTDLKDKGYKVQARINGEAHLLDSWQPYYIEGLPMGKNTIQLTLVDSDGKKVDAPLNPVTREFTLMADPPAK